MQRKSAVEKCREYSQGNDELRNQNGRYDMTEPQIFPISDDKPIDEDRNGCDPYQRMQLEEVVESNAKSCSCHEF